MSELKKGDLDLPSNYKYIEVYLTLKCNLACSFCINTIHNDESEKRRDNLGRKTNNSFKNANFNEIEPDQWINGINRIKTRKGVPITLGGGEPFVYKGFIEVINGIDKDKEIDILTNLRWGQKGLDKFVNEVDPNRLKRDSPYASIRVSYHPGEKGMDPEQIASEAAFLQEKGFSIGIWSVMYPSTIQLSAINQMQFIAKKHGIEYRLKEFVGVYEGGDDLGNKFSITYGDYSKYPDAAFSKEGLKYADCKTSELLIGPSGNVYRCHADLYDGQREIGNLIDGNFKIEDKFRPCYIYGRCNPCDVKVKTDHNQCLGHTSVEIMNIGKKK